MPKLSLVFGATQRVIKTHNRLKYERFLFNFGQGKILCQFSVDIANTKTKVNTSELTDLKLLCFSRRKAKCGDTLAVFSIRSVIMVAELCRDSRMDGSLLQLQMCC